MSAQVCGDVARAPTVPLRRVCTVFTGRGEALVSGAFVPGWIRLGVSEPGVIG